ncbi:MAG: hypothetical protein WB795_06100, partial [Candidatus Acidiferrales bacterium]
MRSKAENSKQSYGSHLQISLNHNSIASRWVAGAAVLAGLLLPGALLAQTETTNILVPAVDVAVNPVTNTIYAL